MIGKGATPSFFAIANDNYTLTRKYMDTKKVIAMTVKLTFSPYNFYDIFHHQRYRYYIANPLIYK